jgi:predicted Zn-dependent protease
MPVPPDQPGDLRPEDSDHLARLRAELDQLLERERYELARDRLGPLLAAHPDDPDLLYDAARIESEIGDEDEADRLIGRVLKLDPKHFEARVRLAARHQEEGRYAEAEATLLELLRDFPENAGLYAQYAFLMFETLHVDKGARLAAEAIRLAPTSKHALFVTAVADLIKDGSSSRVNLEELVTTYPQAYQSGMLLVVTLSEAGKEREALAIAQWMLRDFPNDEALLDNVVELRAATHWSMAPHWPLRRFGFTAAAVMWIVMIGLVHVTATTVDVKLAVGIAVAYILYCVYSWIWPSTYKRWLRRQ